MNHLDKMVSRLFDQARDGANERVEVSQIEIQIQENGSGASEEAADDAEESKVEEVKYKIGMINEHADDFDQLEKISSRSEALGNSANKYFSMDDLPAPHANNTAKASPESKSARSVLE
jgi:hypothetical protein